MISSMNGSRCFHGYEKVYRRDFFRFGERLDLFLLCDFQAAIFHETQKRFRRRYNDGRK